MQSKRLTTILYSLVYFYLKLQNRFSCYKFWYPSLFIILSFTCTFSQNNLLHAEIVASAIVGPTDQELQSWGFTHEEYRSLVQRKVQLEKKLYLLGKKEIEFFRQKLADQGRRPAIDDPGIKRAQTVSDTKLYRRAVEDIETELRMRRCELRNQTPEKFRRTGNHTRMIQDVENELDDLAESVRKLKQKVGAMQKAPTKRVQRPEPQPGNKTRVRDGVNKRGDIPPEQQAEINRKKTGQVAESEGGSQNTDKNNLTKKIDTSNKENIPNTPAASVGQKVRDEINRHGSEIILLTVNLEMIIKCRDSGTDARDCLAQLMVSNGIATSVSMAMQLLSEGAMVKVALVGTGASYLKLGYDTGYLLYNLEEWASAEWERYQIEENREDWTRINLESGSLEHQIEALRAKITATLEPLAASKELGCRNLRNQKIIIKLVAYQDDINKLPSSDAIAQLKNLEDRVYDLMLEQRQLTKMQSEATALSDQLKTDLKQAGDVAQNCTSEKDAQTIIAKYDAAKQNLTQIQNISEKARIIGEKLKSVETEIQQAQSTLQSAFAVKDRISDMNAKIPPYEEIEANINTVNTATQKLEDDGRRLSKEIKALRMAFPDDLDSETEYRIHELDQLIIKLQNKEGCNADSYQTDYNDFAGMALEAKLDAENRLRSVETLHLDLSRLHIGQAAKDWAAIQGLQQEAGELIQNHQDLVEKAEACKNGEASESGDGNGFEDEADEEASNDGTLAGISGSGFSDESDAEDGETQDPADDAPVEADGFSDESDDEAPNVASETVTYFERDFMPQSWKTSGNSQQVRVHLFSLGTRLGWSAALGRHSGPASIELIIDHLKHASIHVKGAHDNSYSPMKIYKNWLQIEKKHQYWIGQLQRKPNMQGRERQLKTLSSSFRSHAMGLAKKIAFQARGNGLEQQENCDSYYLRIGYYLAYASQALTYAAQGQEQGMPKKMVKRIIKDGQSAAASAAQYMRDLKKLKLATGYCIDLTQIANQVYQGTRRGKDLSAKAQAAQKGWQNTLEALGGFFSGTPDLYMEKIGKYVFADMKRFLPQGVDFINQKAQEADAKKKLETRCFFLYKKPFRYGGIIDHNPGFSFSISYQMSKSKTSELNTCKPWQSDVKVVKNGQFKRYEGEGIYCLRSRIAHDGEETIWSTLFWKYGNWSINFHGQDRPNHPATMFGKGDKSIKYMFTVLDHLVPRLNKAIEMYGTSGKIKGTAPSPIKRSPSKNTKGINLLNIEAN